jgi:hypothetical protein
MRVPGPLMLVGLLAASPVWANHDWVGLDLCRTYPERMPPELDPGVLPEPEGPGARLLGRYCGQCHFAPGPGQHSAGEWAQVVPRMGLLMDVTARFGDRQRPIERPSPEERATLLAYLERHALRPLAAGDEAPPAYRTLCGDCHTAPDPTAYAGADWPTLLARMDGHRVTMLRPVADARARAQVMTYLGAMLGVPAGAMLAPGPGRSTANLDGAPLASAPGSASGRWLALGPVFLLTLLGLGRWWRQQRRRV